MLTYASVVSHESVRIALTIATLNALEVKTSNVQNAYLTAPISEKIWTLLGPKWGEHTGKKAKIIVQALNGLKSSAALDGQNGKCHYLHLTLHCRVLGIWTLFTGFSHI